jgi:8-oxo-dGTP pyrophosphatase MutT (NUDIX family)
MVLHSLKETDAQNHVVMIINELNTQGLSNYHMWETISMDNNEEENIGQQGNPKTGDNCQFPTMTSRKAIMDIDRFISMYPTAKQSLKDSAGCVILNRECDKVLLVKGNYAGKWGCPKGSREGAETNIETALRETYEETGYNVELSTSLLPYIVVNKVKLYCLVFGQNQTYKAVDTKEIGKVAWVNIKKLINQVNNNPQEYNSMVKGVCDKIDIIKYKIRSFAPNYSLSLNEHISRVINVLHNHRNNTPVADQSIIAYHYVCFYIVQRMYNNVFTNSDLISFIKDTF